MVRACIELAAADGHMAQSEIRWIEGIGRDLGMSPAYMRGILMEPANGQSESTVR